ncbi:MAG: hypothetical protein II927_08385, partial [Paludibacteraceae bacterium]|nr:hypothetical protein [Paludibacteraceae bacterium]
TGAFDHSAISPEPFSRCKRLSDSRIASAKIRVFLENPNHKDKKMPPNDSFSSGGVDMQLLFA